MNEQRVELFIKERKFSFMIPFNDYVPFKKAEKKIINLIESIDRGCSERVYRFSPSIPIGDSWLSTNRI